MFEFIELFLGNSMIWLILFIISCIVFYFLLKFLDKILSRKVFNIIHFICYAVSGIFLVLFFIKLIIRVFTI